MAMFNTPPGQSAGVARHHSPCVSSMRLKVSTPAAVQRRAPMLPLTAPSTTKASCDRGDVTAQPAACARWRKEAAVDRFDGQPRAVDVERDVGVVGASARKAEVVMTQRCQHSAGASGWAALAAAR